MKIIDLLNKIANGEKDLPNKIKFYDDKYELDEYWGEYITKEGRYLFDYYDIPCILTDEIEIIEDTPKEDKKIEKIDLSEWAEILYSENWEMLASDFNTNCTLFVNKINKIIDYINSKE